MNDSSPVLFRALDRPARLSDRVTQNILDVISTAALRPGDRLPSERDLGEQFGVSRTVVREALRSLAAKGVLDIRSGSGATVARVDAERASEALRLYVQGAHGNVPGMGGVDAVSYEQINDVREMIETKVARMAATAATDSDLDRLRDIHDQFCRLSADPERSSQLDVAFHRAVAESVHNPLFVLMLDSIEPVLLEIRRRVALVPGRAGRAITAHQLILDAVCGRDPDAAVAAMTDHLAESREIWQHLDAGRGDTTSADIASTTRPTADQG